jgi:hypothetical protein
MMEDLHRFTTYTIQLPNTERLPHNDDTWENPIDAANLILKKKYNLQGVVSLKKRDDNLFCHTSQKIPMG